jgi:hypothetical protein
LSRRSKVLRALLLLRVVMPKQLLRHFDKLFGIDQRATGSRPCASSAFLEVGIATAQMFLRRSRQQCYRNHIAAARFSVSCCGAASSVWNAARFAFSDSRRHLRDIEFMFPAAHAPMKFGVYSVNFSELRPRLTPQ